MHLFHCANMIKGHSVTEGKYSIEHLDVIIAQPLSWLMRFYQYKLYKSFNKNMRSLHGHVCYVNACIDIYLLF